MTIYSRNDSKNLYYSFVISGKTYSGSTRTSQRAKALKFERAKRVEIEGQLFHGESHPITLSDAVELFIKFKKYGTSNVGYASLTRVVGRSTISVAEH